MAAASALANYFHNLADPEKNHTWQGERPRPFLQLVFHLVGAERTDDYCQTLCDLRFVEARCRFGQVFELTADYRLALEHLPEAQTEQAEERRRQERVAQWTRAIIDYASRCSDRRDRFARGENVNEPEPSLPQDLPSIEPWSNERIEAECQRIIANPTKLDRLRTFAGFVQAECHLLVQFGGHTGFILQHAHNYAPGGPVHDAARGPLQQCDALLLIHRWSKEAIWPETGHAAHTRRA